MKKKTQHSKIVYNVLLFNSIAWVWASFILAFFDKQQIAENLAITAITTILGTYATLCIKSYKETKQEKLQELEEWKAGYEGTQQQEDNE